MGIIDINTPVENLSSSWGFLTRVSSLGLIRWGPGDSSPGVSTWTLNSAERAVVVDGVTYWGSILENNASGSSYRPIEFKKK